MRRVAALLAIWPADESGSKGAWSRNVQVIGKALNAQVLDQARASDADALVLPLGRGPWTPEAERLAAASRLPVMFLPRERPLAERPFSRIVVPVSGENLECRALDAGLMLAETLGLAIDVVHVSPGREGRRARGDLLLDDQVDEIQHEYPASLEALIARSCPYSGLRLRRALHGFEHIAGDIAEGIERTVKKSPDPLLLLEWRGSLEAGRSRTVKAMLGRLGCGVLLVKVGARPRATLRVGAHFQKERRV